MMYFNRCLLYKHFLRPAAALQISKLHTPHIGVQRVITKVDAPATRTFSSISNPNDKPDRQEKRAVSRSFPRLMNMQEIIWPSAIATIRNFIFVHCIIRPYFDKEFNIKDFVMGAKKAIEVISAKLVNGEFSALTHLVTTDVVNNIKPIVDTLSVSQRQDLQIREEDIYLSFPHQVGIMFNETDERPGKRWVEITMVFHVLRGLAEMRKRGEDIPWNLGTLPEYQNKVFICNYRFIKEFTTGNQSDWTVNAINHFKPIDLINEN